MSITKSGEEYDDIIAKCKRVDFKEHSVNDWVTIRSDKYAKYGDDSADYYLGQSVTELNSKYYSKNHPIVVIFDRLNLLITRVKVIHDYKYFIRIELNDGNEYLVTSAGKIVQLNKPLYLNKECNNIILKNNDYKLIHASYHLLEVENSTECKDLLLIEEDGSSLLIKTGFKNMDYVCDIITFDELNRINVESEILNEMVKIRAVTDGNKLSRDEYVKSLSGELNSIRTRSYEEVKRRWGKKISELKVELEDADQMEEEAYFEEDCYYLLLKIKDTTNKFNEYSIVLDSLDIKQATRHGQPIKVNTVRLK